MCKELRRPLCLQIIGQSAAWIRCIVSDSGDHRAWSIRTQQPQRKRPEPRATRSDITQTQYTHTRTHHISHARGLISLRELLTPASSKVNSACCTRDSGVQLTINHGPMCWLWCKCRVRRAQLTPSDWERHGGICWAFLKRIAGSFFFYWL